MDFLTNPADVMSFESTLLLLFLTTNQALDLPTCRETEEDAEEHFSVIQSESFHACYDVNVVTRAALHNFRLYNISTLFDDDLDFWMKPRSTTWFSRFLMEQYDEQRWIQMFRMAKPAVFVLVDVLQPHVRRQGMKYRLTVPVIVRVACTLFKLTHGTSLFICSELLAIGKSTVSMVLRELVHVINDALRHEISWPSGERLLQIQADFERLCSLLAVVGAIDDTHVSISKPKFGPADYFYFKPGGYTLNYQAIVDSNKWCLDLYLGTPGSTNDTRVLRRSSLYQKAMHRNLFDAPFGAHGFSPYLLGDSGYPLLPWLMVPHRGLGHFPVADTLFNRRLRRG
jgi:hypothetical protein